MPELADAPSLQCAAVRLLNEMNQLFGQFVACEGLVGFLQEQTKVRPLHTVRESFESKITTQGDRLGGKRMTANN